jgi:hypothetical protein
MSDVNRFSMVLFVWARRALNSQKRRVLARAVTPPAAIHRMGIVMPRKALANEPSHRDQFERTIEQLWHYFHTYELSKR